MQSTHHPLPATGQPRPWCRVLVLEELALWEGQDLWPHGESDPLMKHRERGPMFQTREQSPGTEALRQEQAWDMPGPHRGQLQLGGWRNGDAGQEGGQAEGRLTGLGTLHPKGQELTAWQRLSSRHWSSQRERAGDLGTMPRTKGRGQRAGDLRGWIYGLL